MKTKLKLGRFVAPGVLFFPFLQSLYVCPFPLPWVVCNECPVFSCLMNPKTTPLRRVLLANFLVSGFLVGRAFCSWACPFGALQEMCSTFAGKLGGINPLRGDLRTVRVFLALLTFLAAFSLAYPILMGFLPQLLGLSFVLNPIYAVGVALNSFLLTVPWVIGLLRVFIFTLFLGLSMLWKRTWCKVCPLGAVISLFNKVSLVRLRVNRDKCDWCNKCFSACQMNLKPQCNGLSSVDCIMCLDCVQECEASAIEVKPRILKSRLT